MKITMDGEVFEGTPIQIIECFRAASFKKEDFPDAESYLKYLQNHFVRMTNQPCELPDGSLDERAAAMLGCLAGIGALEILEENA